MIDEDLFPEALLDLTAQIASIPASVANVEETEWEKVKDFFRSIL